MSRDGGWHRRGRHDTEDPDPRVGRDSRYGSPPAGNGYQGRYPEGGNWPQDGYERPGRHGGPAGYGSQEDYGRRDYDGSGGYGDQPGASYYGQPGGYGDQPGASYYRQPGGYGDETGYGPGSGSNGSSYGQDSYGSYADSSYRRDGYGQGSYGMGDPYGYPGGPAGHQPDTGQGWDQIGRRDTDSYGTADTGSYGAAGQGSYDPLDTGSYPPPGSDRYDRNGYAQGRSYQPDDSGVYDWADSGSFNLGEPASPHDSGERRYEPSDSGTFWGPSTGPVGRRPSAGPYDQDDAGAFDPAESDRFDRPDTGSSGRNAGHARAVDEPMPPGRGPLPGGAEGYASWHDDPDDKPLWEAQDDDPWDDDESGMLSRRFGRDREGGGRGERKGRGDRGSAARGRKGRAKRPKQGRGRAASAIALLIVFALIGGAGFFGYRLVHSWIIHRYGDYSGPGTGKVTITVPQGASLVGLGPILLKDNVIMALRPYNSAAGAALNASSLQPGTYALHYHMNSALVVKLLLSGKTRVNNTFTVYPDGRAADIAALLAKHANLPLSQFTQIIDHPTSALGLPSWAAGHSAEGFLYPDTYRLAPNQTPLQILQAMVADFNHRTASLHLPAAAPKVYTTPFHIIIVASLIQAEGNATDFRQVSRVIWNRLKDNMPLQFDSTVFYAMHKFGTSITAAEEKFPSPYNTYLHLGLPPGPIGSPGLAAIQAALHPLAGNWLYFITDVKSPTHKTYFTASLAQFHKWQQQFQG